TRGWPAWRARSRPTRRHASRRRAARRHRAPRSSPRRSASQRLPEQLRGPATLVLGGHESDSEVALPGRPEEGAGRDDDARLEQLRRERLRVVVVVRHLEPEVHGRLAAGDANAQLAKDAQEDVSLAPVEIARGG